MYANTKKVIMRFLGKTKILEEREGRKSRPLAALVGWKRMNFSLWKRMESVVDEGEILVVEKGGLQLGYVLHTPTCSHAS